MIRYILFFAGTLFLISCSAKTTVILLPEQDNNASAVIVSNDRSSIALEKPYSSATVGNTKSRIDTKTIEKNKVEGDYKTLFQAEPLKPVSILLYFDYNLVFCLEPRTGIPQIRLCSYGGKPDEQGDCG